MNSYLHIVRMASKEITKAIDGSVKKLADGKVEHEPAFTDRMLGAIEERLSDFKTRGVVWSAKTLTDRGRNAQEGRFGADFMGVLDVKLHDFTVKKGFLAQAKLLRRGRRVEMEKLKEQCDRMLQLSPDSFVFLYSMSGVRVVPALAVVSSDLQPTDLYSRSAQRFFEEHLQCFVGDGAIKAAARENLEALAERYETRAAIQILARST